MKNEPFETWMRPPAMPDLPPAEAHAWLAVVPEIRPKLVQALLGLSQDELERAGRFRHEADRERYCVARATLRRLFAHYSGIPPAEIRFVDGPHGKPELKGGTHVPLHFNSSHSGDLAIVAFARSGSVGVDVEGIRPEMPRREEMAHRFFSPGESAQLAALPEPERATAFFDCWTRKEAFVKARGDGIFAGLSSFEVSIDRLGPARLIHPPPEDSRDWWMSALDLGAGYSGAIVVQSRGCALRCWRITPQLLSG